jgi:hypothetical protein
VYGIPSIYYNTTLILFIFIFASLGDIGHNTINLAKELREMEAKPYKIPHPFRKLTKKLIDTIVNDIKEGSTHCYATETNGITEAIFSIWRAQGKIDIEFDLETLPAYLVKSLAKIKQEEIKWCREQIKKNKKGHKGAEWTLEHAYWRHYGTSAAAKELAEEVDEIRNSLLHGEGTNGEVECSEEK